jgi:very-short-patch-repair endonuclease
MPKRSDYNAARLTGLLIAQDCVITRAQALGCGIPASTIDRWISPGGRWQLLLPGIYLALTGRVGRDYREMAALLYAGPDSIITGNAALKMHGMDPPEFYMVDVLVPSHVRRKSVGFLRVQRTMRMPVSRYTIGERRFSDPARAVADAARGMRDFRDVRKIVSEALLKKRCTLGQLVTELREGPTQRCGLLRRAVDEVSDGVRSGAEADFRRLLIRGRISGVMYNAKLYTPDGTFIAMVDAWIGEAGVAAEIDSRAYHTTPDAQDRDTDRHDKLVALGVLVLHFKPERVSKDGPGVLAELRGAIHQGRQRPPLQIIALPIDEAWSATTSQKSRRPRTQSFPSRSHSPQRPETPRPPRSQSARRSGRPSYERQ